MTLRNLFGGLAVATAFIAAVLWFRASLIHVPTQIGSGYGSLVGVEEMSAGFEKQARWNAFAAAMTGVAAVFQGVALWLP
jgi:hypothetical protein